MEISPESWNLVWGIFFFEVNTKEINAEINQAPLTNLTQMANYVSTETKKKSFLSAGCVPGGMMQKPTCAVTICTRDEQTF